MPGVRIGTSGWNYSHWRDIFYPHGLKQGEWLGHYASVFDTVEINATFYRLPKPEYVTRWAEAVPDDFLFSVKGSRYLTHVKRLGMTGEPVDRFIDLVRLFGDKAGPLLWQLPPTMKRDDDRLGVFAGALPGEWRHVFEFRNPSWYAQEVFDILERAGCGLCIPVHPEMERAEVLTAGWTYIRFHYGGEDGLFSQGELEEWAERIRGFLDDGADVYAYFNNDWQGHAIENARELRGMLEG